MRAHFEDIRITTVLRTRAVLELAEIVANHLPLKPLHVLAFEVL